MTLTVEMIRKARAMLEAHAGEPVTVLLHKGTKDLEQVRARFEAAGYVVRIQEPMPVEPPA